MGHELLKINNATKAVRDGDLLLLSHFLTRAAEEIGEVSLSQELGRWKFHGPGVWVGVEPKLLQGQSVLFAKAEHLLVSFGESISEQYLRRIKEPGVRFSAVETEHILVVLKEVQSFVESHA